MGDRKKSSSKDTEAREPVIENRKARFDYAIGDTLECGLKLVGTEVKSLRKGQASLAEGWVLASVEPPELTLLNVTIAEYPPAGAHRQHVPNRARRLLALPFSMRLLLSCLALVALLAAAVVRALAARNSINE